MQLQVTICNLCHQQCDLFDVDVGGEDILTPSSQRQYVSYCCRVGYTTELVDEKEIACEI